MEGTNAQTESVPQNIQQWDETFAKEEETWFFGREPSELARQTANYWKILHGERLARVLDSAAERDAMRFTSPERASP